MKSSRRVTRSWLCSVVRRALAVGLVMAAAPALADPCAVTIVRAPAAVRATVESWLATERCGVSLAVRIVESEGELYIFAIDDKGGVRERTVPDAQSAGLLIASWTADDGLTTPTSVAAPVPTPSIESTPAPTPVPSVLMASDTTVREHFDGRPIHSLESQGDEHWLTLAAGSTMTSGFAGRAEIEVVRHQGFAVSIVTGIAQNRDAASLDSTMTSTFHPSYTDLVAMVGVQHTWRWPRWHVRAGVAAGVVVSSLSLDWTNPYGNSVRETASLVSLVTEASTAVGYAVTAHWEAEVGPAITSSNQGYYLPNQMETLLRRPWSVAVYVGVRRSL